MKKYFINLRISHMLLLSSVTFILPIAVLFFYVMSGFNDNIRFVHLELWGSHVSKPLAKLIRFLPEHRRMAHFYLRGDKALRKKLDFTSGVIDKVFSDLLTETERYGVSLKIDEDSLRKIEMEHLMPSTLHIEWQALLSVMNNITPEQSDERHVRLLNGVLGLISRTGNTSNLIRDPDMNAYHLIYNVFVGIPQVQERVSGIMMRGQDVFSRNQITGEDKVKFAEFAEVVENYYMKYIRQNLSFALEEDRNYSGESLSLQKNLSPVFAHYELTVNNFIDMVNLLNQDKNTGVSADKFLKLGESVLDASSSFNQAAITELNILLEERMTLYRRQRLLAYFLIIAALAVSAGIVFLISRGITRPLSMVTRIAGEIAEGDIEKAGLSLKEASASGLCAEMEEEEHEGRLINEVRQLFRAIARMTFGLDTLLNQVRKSGVQVTGSTTQIAASVHQLEAAVAEQAASTNQVTTLSNEISGTVNDLARTMNNVTDMAAKSSDHLNDGVQNLAAIITIMHTLSGAAGEISEKLEIVSEKAGNINKVITTITKVANQTNLLSLNAAIEAEKAGNYGAGFSVVAGEIRRLADQTAVAALDIEEMILEMQKAIEDSVAGMGNYKDEARLSSERTTGISEELSTIIENTRELIPQFEVVNQGIQMQSKSAAQISDAMKQLNITANQTRDSLVEFRKITEQLNEAVDGLQKVSQFTKRS